MTVLSLFSGIGGLDLGIKIAIPEARVVGYVEADGYCQRVLAARMADGSLDPAPLHGDVTTFDGLPWRGSVDLISGGFPCQDVSNAGRRAGIGGERSGLWSHFARLAGEIRPGFVFVENVAALLNRGIYRVLGDLSALGYDAQWLRLSAADVGAPHLRQRIFVLGYTRGSQWRTGGDHPAGRSVLSASTRQGAACDEEGNRQQHRTGARSDVLVDARCERNGADQPQPVARSSGETDAGVVLLTMGDTDEFRSQERNSDRSDEGQDSGTGRARLPLFPPGPGVREQWAAILQAYPGLAPAVESSVCPLDDGLSSRVAQLKACGNAVLPIQAAAALTILLGRLK